MSALIRLGILEMCTLKSRMHDSCRNPTNNQLKLRNVEEQMEKYHIR
jgi:hypothetical protein